MPPPEPKGGFASKLPGINPGANKYEAEIDKKEKPFVENVVFGLTWVRPRR